MTWAHGATPGSPWAFVANPGVWTLVAMLLVGYFWALRALGPRYAPQYGLTTRRQKTLFVLGVISLWAASDWPLHQLSEGFLFSAHMVQHMIFWLVTPPLLLLGTPAWMLRLLLRPRPLWAAARFATKPLVAFVASNAMIVLIHWPALVAFQLTSEPAHLLVHLLILGAATLMWWPIIGPLPELGRLRPPAAMLYLFLQSLLPTGPASFLTFGTTQLYAGYDGVPDWGISAITDQQVSGLIMKIGGGLVLWAVIAVTFFKWGAREDGRHDAL